LKVILTGDGADELLGGYDFWYLPLCADFSDSNKLEVLFYKLYGRLLRIFHSHKANSIAYKLSSPYPQNKDMLLRKKYEHKAVYFSDHELTELLPSSSHSLLYRSDLARVSDNFNDVLDMDILNYLPGDILVKIDRSAMAHGLELRAPFLDVDLASFILSLPPSLKLSNERSKVLLRLAYQEQWTRAIRQRGKQGFGAPVQKWLKLKSVTQLKKQYLQGRNLKLFSLLNEKNVQRHIQQNDYKTWILLVLSIWMEHNSFKYKTYAA
jgi:asparagine synthase (glutamine-hydrolysing)